MEPHTKKWLIWGGVAVAALLMLWLVFRSSGGSSSPAVRDVGVGGISFGNSASSLAALGAFGGGIPGVKINPGTVTVGTDTGSSVTSTTGAGSASKPTAAPASQPKPSTGGKIAIVPIEVAASGPGVYQAPASTAPAQNPLTKHLQP